MVQQRLVRDFYNVLNQVNAEEIPADLKLPDSFSQLVSEMKNNQYDAKTFAIMLRAMVRYHHRSLIVFWLLSSKLVSQTGKLTQQYLVFCFNLSLSSIFSFSLEMSFVSE